MIPTMNIVKKMIQPRLLLLKASLFAKSKANMRNKNTKMLL